MAAEDPSQQPAESDEAESESAAGEQTDFVDERIVRETFNEFERVRSALGDGDDFLAALLANQVRLGQIEHRQNELIQRQVDILAILSDAELPPGLDTGIEFDPDVSTRASVYERALRSFHSGHLISFPQGGDRHAFPAAANIRSRIQIDLREGVARVPGVGNVNIGEGLDSIDAPRAISAFLWADNDIRVYTYDRSDTQSGIWKNDQSGYIAVNAVEMDRVELESDYPFYFGGLFSTGPAGPQYAFPIANHTDRYGQLTTTAQTLQAVPMVPDAADDLGEASLNDAVTEHGMSEHGTNNIGQATYIIEETAGNADAEVQLRMNHVDGEAEVADYDVHGSVSTAGTNVVTVSAGSTALLETNINSRVKELYAQSADGTEVQVSVQFRGHSPGLR